MKCLNHPYKLHLSLGALLKGRWSRTSMNSIYSRKILSAFNEQQICCCRWNIWSSRGIALGYNERHVLQLVHWAMLQKAWELCPTDATQGKWHLSPAWTWLQQARFFYTHTRTHTHTLNLGSFTSISLYYVVNLLGKATFLLESLNI